MQNYIYIYCISQKLKFKIILKLKKISFGWTSSEIKYYKTGNLLKRIYKSKTL